MGVCANASFMGQILTTQLESGLQFSGYGFASGCYIVAAMPYRKLCAALKQSRSILKCDRNVVLYTNGNVTVILSVFYVNEVLISHASYNNLNIFVSTLCVFVDSDQGETRYDLSNCNTGTCCELLSFPCSLLFHVFLSSVLLFIFMHHVWLL